MTPTIEQLTKACATLATALVVNGMVSGEYEPELRMTSTTKHSFVKVVYTDGGPSLTRWHAVAMGRTQRTSAVYATATYDEARRAPSQYAALECLLLHLIAKAQYHRLNDALAQILDVTTAMGLVAHGRVASP